VKVCFGTYPAKYTASVQKRAVCPSYGDGTNIIANVAIPEELKI
jgi:hypothetical protein